MNDVPQTLRLVAICIGIGLGVTCALAVPLWLTAKLLQNISPRAFDYLSGRKTASRPNRQRLIQSVLIAVLGAPSLPMFGALFTCFCIKFRGTPAMAAWDYYYARLPILVMMSGVPALTTAVQNLVPQAWVNRLFRNSRCPQCQTGTLYEYRIHTTPPQSWSLWQCCQCGTDYVRESDRLVRRTEWTGPLIVEHFFLIRDNPGVDPNELRETLEASRSEMHDDQA